jgi:hypothetical protein
MSKEIDPSFLAQQAAELYKQPREAVYSIPMPHDYPTRSETYFPFDTTESVFYTLLQAGLDIDANPELIKLLERSVRRRVKNWREIRRKRQEQADQLNGVSR